MIRLSQGAWCYEVSAADHDLAFARAFAPSPVEREMDDSSLVERETDTESEATEDEDAALLPHFPLPDIDRREFIDHRPLRVLEPIELTFQSVLVVPAHKVPVHEEAAYVPDSWVLWSMWKLWQAITSVFHWFVSGSYQGHEATFTDHNWNNFVGKMFQAPSCSFFQQFSVLGFWITMLLWESVTYFFHFDCGVYQECPRRELRRLAKLEWRRRHDRGRHLSALVFLPIT